MKLKKFYYDIPNLKLDIKLINYIIKHLYHNSGIIDQMNDMQYILIKMKVVYKSGITIPITKLLKLEFHYTYDIYLDILLELIKDKLDKKIRCIIFTYSINNYPKNHIPYYTTPMIPNRKYIWNIMNKESIC
jgi:hypothetical protein